MIKSSEIKKIVNEYSDVKIVIGEGDKWLEVLGCGMVHPNVLKNCKVNTSIYQGYAFGIGIDRFGGCSCKASSTRLLTPHCSAGMFVAARMQYCVQILVRARGWCGSVCFVSSVIVI